MHRPVHSLVCLKVVPKSEEVQVDRQTMTLDRANARSEINPPDMNALEAALSLKDRYGGRVSLLSMGPPFVAAYLRMGIAMGADAAFLLSDRAFGGADTLATSRTLAAAIVKIGGVDLIVCGEESSDGATAQVPPGIAAWLDLPQATYAMTIDHDSTSDRLIVTREIQGGEEELELPLPAVVSVKAGSNEPRFMDIDRLRDADALQPVVVWTAADLGVDPAFIGAPGSPTSVTGIRSASAATGRRRQVVAGSPQEKAAAIYEELVRVFGGTPAATSART
ncbi:MAG: electron transfer flavoprotein subunit beta/FixA family protein [Dehalococcoidia bacterium]